METAALSFPGLGLEFHINRIAIPLGSRGIYWYGIIIALGFLLAVFYCTKAAPRYGITEDNILDMLIRTVPVAIVGARLYYVLFYLDQFRVDGKFDWAQAAAIWDGGLAIYGAVIAAALSVFVFCRRRGISFGAFADLGSFGLLIGQLVGRWGNFVNQEAYGGVTGSVLRMSSSSIASDLWEKGLVDTDGYYAVVNGTLGVHPTFLYESLWNLAGFLLLTRFARRHRRFDGEIFLLYIAWYGFGRMLIEGLRTDSLYFFGLKLFGAPVRVSQVLGGLSCAAALVILFLRLRRGTSQEGLYVNKKKPPQEAGDGE
ncbi:MAG TPA: prolipoprotein diacylglyceryl transferase [Oscillospiraceae bacterium]|nr:prolipoprotein diacylglyceryl transferase [Oscillospiraceae bacterium]